MTDEEIPPAALSAFDQAFAHSSQVLDELLAAHRENVERLCVAEGLPEAAAIFGLSRFIYEELDPGAAASALAVAIVRIDRALQEFDSE